MPYDTPAQATAAVLYAVRTMSEFFTPSDPGTITVADDGRLQFKPSANGKHRTLNVDPTQKEKAIQTLVELASAKPPQPQGRGPRNNADKGKAAPQAPVKQ
jgi:hypothetical protein